MFAKTAKIVAVNLLVLLVLLVAAELTFGTWFSKDPLDKLGLPRRTAVKVDATSLYPGGGEHVFRRDRWGFRGAVDPAKVVILTLGGSTTNQLYLPEDLTWQAAMAARLGELGRGDVVIANAGLDGQSTVGHVRVVEDWLPHVPDLKPRFVLAYVGLNDVFVPGSSIDRLEHSSTAKWIRQHSAVYRFGRTVAGTFSAHRARLMHSPVDYRSARWVDVPSGVAAPDFDKAAYQDRLRRMAAGIHALGAVPVFVTQGRGDSRIEGGKLVGLVAESGPNGLDQHQWLARVNVATLEFCQDDGLLCLDLARELTFAPGDFYDRLHNTPQGAAKIGRWLAERLAGLV